MTLFIQKYRHILTFASAALIGLSLSACGNIDLSGAAGLDEPTEEPAVNPTDDAAVEVPPTEVPPATGHIIFSSNRDGQEGQTDLYMTTPDGLEIARLTTDALVDEGSAPRLSPDGTRVAFSSTVGDNTDIYILDIASGSITRVTDAQEKDSAPSWSPNGQQFAFESFRDGNLEIYVANADGSNPTRLTNDPAGDSNPVWSPVSNDIVFVSNRFGNSDLFLLSPNGAVSTLTTNPAPDNIPAWSPNGNFIAFQSFTGDLSNICIIGRDGLNQVCITPNLAMYGMPVWAQDGQRIATNFFMNGTYGIHVFNIIDGSIVQLTQSDVEPRGVPAWSPDELRLVFQAQSGGDMEIYSALIQSNEFTRITSIPGYDGEPVWVNR
ncbi:MAG: PD40 domain-containing protein [Chloroflexi bacterium]|nr:PD40 domain-containing protein [Chloroflexota bacterium]